MENYHPKFQSALEYNGSEFKRREERIKSLAPLSDLIEGLEDDFPNLTWRVDTGLAELDVYITISDSKQLSYLANKAILLTEHPLLDPEIIQISRRPGDLCITQSLLEDSYCKLNIRFTIKDDSCERVFVGMEPKYKYVC